jgi:hypothetical protein
VIEEKVSPAGSVSCWVVTASGRRCHVQLPKGTDTPANIAELAELVAGRRG